MHSTLLLSTLLALGASAAVVPYTFNIENVDLSPDGFTRSTVTANGVFPGTLITANKGDTLQITVNNQLTNPDMRRSTTVHWHGLLQSRSAGEDGPAFVTQCPIAPGHSYTYEIALDDNQAGTFWYHSHLASQYVDGLRGGLIIYDPNDPHLSLYDVDDANTIIQLADWYHTPAPALEEQYFATTNTNGQEPVPDSALINGKGHYNGGPTVDRAVIEVEQGKKYRFRVINTSAFGSYRFAIAGHSLTIIELDGINSQPLTVDYFDILAGQRYSVVVDASQPIDNYWITAPITVRGAATNTNLDATGVAAILRYTGAAIAEPTVSIPTASGTALQEYNIKTLDNPGAPGGSDPADVVYNVTFARATDSEGRAAFLVNGIQYRTPSVPTLLNILANGYTQDSDFSTSEHTIVLERDKVIELNISGGPNHPIHLHGHAFDIIQSAAGPANYVDPPRRDVVASVGGGVITIRFRTDNPGPWVVHCHIDWHLEAGLALVFAEAPTDQISGSSSVQVSSAWQELCPIYNALDAEFQ